ncbi:MAG: hypothetical protein ACRDHF_13265 [Tepidiformaceae bacterium]
MSPADLPKLDVSLLEPEARLVLESLTELEAKWTALCETPEGAADYGNDLIILRGLLEGFRRRAVERFGFGIANMSREPLT